MSTIGNRIRNKRHELGMSVDELAARLGKNRATVYRYESDEIENFPIAVIAPLADALNTTPAYLMGWDNDSGKSEAAPTSPEEDGRMREFIELFGKLTADQQALIIAQIKGILSAQ